MKNVQKKEKEQGKKEGKEKGRKQTNKQNWQTSKQTNPNKIIRHYNRQLFPHYFSFNLFQNQPCPQCRLQNPSQHAQKPSLHSSAPSTVNMTSAPSLPPKNPSGYAVVFSNMTSPRRMAKQRQRIDHMLQNTHTLTKKAEQATAKGQSLPVLRSTGCWSYVVLGCRRDRGWRAMHRVLWSTNKTASSLSPLTDSSVHTYIVTATGTESWRRDGTKSFPHL